MTHDYIGIILLAIIGIILVFFRAMTFDMGEE